MIERRSSHDHKEGCVFCELPDERRIDLGVSSFYGSYDAFPLNPGHMEIIPIRHVDRLLDLTKKERGELFEAVENGIEVTRNTDLRVIYQKGLENPVNEESVWFLQQALNNPNINVPAADYTFGVNDGPFAGRTIDHLHWHTIPRYEGDVTDPRGGIRYVIPDLANYKIPRGK